MVTFRQFLERNARFFSPGVKRCAISVNTSDVNNVEVSYLDTRWKPTAARRDDRMVDSLLTTLHDCLGDRPLPVEQAKLDKLFQPLLDWDGQHPSWSEVITDEYDASRLVGNGALVALKFIMKCLGHPIKLKHNVKAPVDDINSHVDFALALKDDEEKKILVEIKSPSVLQGAINKMQGGSFPLLLASHGRTDEKVITKLCIYMAAHKTHWAAVTSHDKWVFLRLHPDLKRKPPKPYISFSTVEAQANSTRPFRALLAMMLATAMKHDVASHADKRRLTAIPEHKKGKYEQQNDPGEDKSGPYRGSGKSFRHEGYNLHCQMGLGGGNGGVQPSDLPGLVFGWSEVLVPKPELFVFSEIGRTALRPSLGDGIIRLSLQRTIGKGLTGTVYEAKRAGDKSNSRSYAVKLVVKGKFEEESGYVDQLRNEFHIYCKIESAKKNGKIPMNVAPNCYGLYESDSLLVLLMDYEGIALSDEEWQALRYSEKAQIFNLMIALHKIGIDHYDFEPRNILRTPSGTFKIIDFAFAKLHECHGIRQVRWDKAIGGGECDELKGLWEEFGVDQHFLQAATHQVSH